MKSSDYSKNSAEAADSSTGWMNGFPPAVFVTGTDTGIGKTVIAAILLAGLRGVYWKPIQSGMEDLTDREWVKRHAGAGKDRLLPETYLLKRPLAPYLSAAAQKIRMDLDDFELPRLTPRRHLIVEGAGGILVPINERHYMLDIMQKLAIPVILVASSRLGTINHTLLSLEQLRRRRLDIWGVVMNGPPNPDNRQAIQYYGGVEIVAEVAPMAVMNPRNLRDRFQKVFKPLLK